VSAPAAPPPEGTPAAPPEPGMRCPGCGSELGPDQDWCMQCGRAATTRVIPPRGWRIPYVIVALLVAGLGAGLALLFVSLSGDDDRIVTSGELTRTVTVTTASPTTAAPAPAPTPTAPPTTPTAPPATPTTTTPTTPTTPTTTSPTPTTSTTPTTPTSP
jgi:hypothetical protein